MSFTAEYYTTKNYNPSVLTAEYYIVGKWWQADLKKKTNCLQDQGTSRLKVTPKNEEITKKVKNAKLPKNHKSTDKKC